MFRAQDVFSSSFFERSSEHWWSLISPMHSVDESNYINQLLPLVHASREEQLKVESQTKRLIESLRADKKSIQMIDALLLEYSLDSQEGIILMCLAEALMRIPDTDTMNAFIRDKLSMADWQSHLESSDTLFVNASTWGLMLTGKVTNVKPISETPKDALKTLVNKFSEPVIRKMMKQAMKVMGHQFILGEDIQKALNKSDHQRGKQRYSFDMLGEAALTKNDAQRYFDDYKQAIKEIGSSSSASESTLSIKLTALFARYETSHEHRVMTEMFERVLELLIFARSMNVGVTIDAEEADRLELSLKLFKQLYLHDSLKNWGKLGLAVQTYSKRALPVLAWLAALSNEQGAKIPVRLVKGAYWDSEIKWAQQRGLSGYPVFTRKENTDISYLVCARFMLSNTARECIEPQFATHNAYTISAIQVMATHEDYEFQRLHGMGEALYKHAYNVTQQPLRIYAPVGKHKDLLPYLVRRLLENGANSSFVHRLVDANCSVDELAFSPVDYVKSLSQIHHPFIPLPEDIFGVERKNSQGFYLDVDDERLRLLEDIKSYQSKLWYADTLIRGERIRTESQQVHSPYDHDRLVGEVSETTPELAKQALEQAHQSFEAWSKTPQTHRSDILKKFAVLLEEHHAELIALCHHEAGKTLQDSIDEVREAVDFCRYYAFQANQNNLEGRGVFVCISPWNFPLAIFLGQICGALVVGNTVVAKPAQQTPLIAYRAIELLMLAGVPAEAIYLVLGGATIGKVLTEDMRVEGVAFTGSTTTAQVIQRSLVARDKLPVPLIAETGGQNAMIVDSTALPEQVVTDVIRSAFASAGQRCSALRVLYLQEEIADRIIELIQGAMAELTIGNPIYFETDVGPIIDKVAMNKLQEHIESLKRDAKILAQAPLLNDCSQGTFIAPIAFEIDSITQLKQEHFGPILHVLRYSSKHLDSVIDEINATGFGLTFGIHSRNEQTYQYIEQKMNVGNCYINRDQVGAVVGVQPFGGRGLSGTGPKAGGPHYLLKFGRVKKGVAHV